MMSVDKTVPHTDPWPQRPVILGCLVLLMGMLGFMTLRPNLPSQEEVSQWGLLAGVRDGLATSSLRSAALNQAPGAALTLGLILSQRPEPSEAAQGRQWLEQAAELGDFRAQLALGKLLYKGAAGMPPNPEAALPWLRSAAQSGQAAAAHYLALILKNGSAGLPPDATAAAHWMRIAAEAGFADSQFLLGQMLLSGSGIQADKVQAKLWFEKAAEQDHPEAALELLMATSRSEMGLKFSTEAEDAQMREAAHALHHRPPPP
jgi:TPR repeat protein